MVTANSNYHNENNLVAFWGGQKFKTILADPPWQFQNRTGKMAPEHKRLNRYPTLKSAEIKAAKQLTSHWEKVRKDGGPDGRGVGFYFRNVTELLLFGVKGSGARTLAPGRSRVNLLRSRKREHYRKPDEIFDLIESCSNGPYLELFARGHRPGWALWGNQAGENYEPDWATYKNAGQNERPPAGLSCRRHYEGIKSLGK